jgi:hypothetical protein
MSNIQKIYDISKFSWLLLPALLTVYNWIALPEKKTLDVEGKEKLSSAINRAAMWLVVYAAILFVIYDYFANPTPVRIIA